MDLMGRVTRKLATAEFKARVALEAISRRWRRSVRNMAFI
jgi:hypothetical protein